MCTYLCFFDWDKFVKTKKGQVVIIEELKMLNYTHWRFVPHNEIRDNLLGVKSKKRLNI